MRKMKPFADGIKLNCTVVADTHIDIKHPTPWLPQLRLSQVLDEMINSKCPVDAFVIAGDMTSRGTKINWELFREVFKDRKKCANELLFVLGNHDTWNDSTFADAFAEYKSALSDVGAFVPEKVYFSKEVNGFPFIFLSSEFDGGCEANIGEEQLTWFAEQMKEASKKKSPIFVFCHQSLNGKHGLPMTSDKDGTFDLPPEEGGVGAASQRIEEILKKYKNVYYISGHSHMGLAGERCAREGGYSTFEEEDGVTFINLPSLACGNHHGDEKSFTTGIQIEVYDKKVIIRPRSFAKHKWIKSVAIKNGRPYYFKETE